MYLMCTDTADIFSALEVTKLHNELMGNMRNDLRKIGLKNGIDLLTVMFFLTDCPL